MIDFILPIILSNPFNPNHIEAILMGIETQPNTTQTFEIHQLNTITYNNQC